MNNRMETNKMSKSEKIDLIEKATKFIEELDEVEHKAIADQYRVKRNKESRENIYVKIIVVVFIVLLICAGFLVFQLGSCMLSSSDDSEYTTHYQDDNGNGKLDQGEWNYTVDDNGDIVDIDDDLSNFE